jgi:hypothetical protein
LHKGFKSFYDNSSHLFSDITLVVGLEKIPAHKVLCCKSIGAHVVQLVLCTWSDTFKAMLENSTWKESSMEELKVQVRFLKDYWALSWGRRKGIPNFQSHAHLQ